MTGSTFSETWHRVADARFGLLPTVQVHKQFFRGRQWYVLRDTFSQRFYRVTPQAYAFISRLTPARTVDEIWQDFLERQPEQAPGQEEVTQVLAQLHHANLLYFRTRPDSAEIFNRYREYRQRKLLGNLLGFLYLRIPLWDPNDWLNHLRPLIRILTGKTVVALWFLVVFFGAKAAVENSAALFTQTQGILALGNLIWLYLCLIVLKGLHELGHAFVCKRYGGNVHTMGIMLLVFTPMPYIDATSSWAFRDRWARALVGAAGILVELFLAAAGALVWANTASGLINSLAFNLMVIGSVSSLLFNGNPLLRFDAYYILSDLTDIPNLYQKSSQHWFYFADRYLLGTPNVKSPAGDRREWCWLTVYGALSFPYRILITLGILLRVADRWPAVAILFLISTFIVLVVMSIKKLVVHLGGAKVQRNRVRAISVTLLLLTLIMGAMMWIPLPYGIKAPGIVEAVQATMIHTNTGGWLEALYVHDGDGVAAGQPIARLRNPVLALDITLTRQQIIETKLLYSQAMERSLSDLAPLERRLKALGQQEQELEKRSDQLVVRAPHVGDWVGPPLHEELGSWIARGALIGELVNPDHLRFTAVVSQTQADELFASRLTAGQLRLPGQAGQILTSSRLQILPYQHHELASAALGWKGGGGIAVNPEDRQGRLAAESFYELRMYFAVPPGVVALDGMSGWIRIALDPKPLYWQLHKAVKQLLQKRYRL